MNSRKLEGTEEVRPPRLTTNGKGLELQSRGSGPLLFPERFVQSAAPPHLVHVRGTHRGVGILPSAGPSLCVIAPVLWPIVSRAEPPLLRLRGRDDAPER